MHARWRVILTVALAIATVAFGALTAGVNADDATARAVVKNGNGNQVGVVKFIQQGDKVLVKAEAEFPTSGTWALSDGFHGFHIHALGVCTPAAFTSAGGHYKTGSQVHGEHAGDMPVLLVNGDGTASSRFTTDSFTVGAILNRAVIVHVDEDNYANIPTRYHSHDATFNPGGGFGPDTDTLAKGDAGNRYACGVIEASN